ncbi:MAG: hypothetical protein A2107_04755 [Verrucomicrobia bacterium GWF2_62_7]|nr:MAG: hypothetical protein A2107_04755 [Verrucomicrobia bacterium GWF2_62_7]
MDMPEEPHKNIEDALKAYAKQRRDATGEPLDMPSHTRTVLQREIAQRAAGTKPASRPWFEPLVALWPRLAVGAAAVATVGIAMLVLTDIGKKAEPPMELAKVEPQAQSLALLDRSGMEADSARKLEEKLSETRGLTVAQSRASGTGKRPLDEKLKAAGKLDGIQTAANWAMAKEKAAKAAPVEAKLQVVAMTAAPSAAPMPTAAAPSAPAKPALALAGLAPAVAPAPAEQPPAPAMPAPTDAGKAERADTTRLVTAAISNMAPLSQRLRFAQVADDRETEPAKQPRQQQPQPPQVLASFQLEQTGDRVVITDADGSIYEGRIQLASTSQQQVALERRASRSRLAPTRAAAPRQVMTQAGEFVWRDKDATAGRRLESGVTGQQLYFTAVGTNRSVNQRVVVNGMLSSPADGTLAYGSFAGGGRITFEAGFGGTGFAPATSPAPSAVSDSNAVLAKSGQLVLPPGPAASPVPAAPQASAQIEGTLRVGNTPEVEITAVGVGP